MSNILAFNQCNRLVHITEVDRGLACNCRCVACNELLIARQGEKREHHFAHASNLEPCPSDYESLLHRYAKQCIVEANGLVVPITSAVAQVLGNELDDKRRLLISSQRIDEEIAVGDIRPDLLVTTTEGTCVALEVAYSSFCDEDKISIYEDMQLPALEIDLSQFDPESFEPKAVKYAVVEALESKIWLWPTEVQPVEAPREPISIRLQEEIIDFSGRWVSTKILPSGDITIKALRYDPDLYSLIKSVARNNDGKFQPAYKTWLIPRWRAFIAKEQLRQLSQEVIFTIQQRTN